MRQLGRRRRPYLVDINVTRITRSDEARSAFALRPALVVVALKCALTFAVAGRYGWHRDEFYYAVAGRHLQGGYVEFPPVTALLAALARELFGWSLVGLRPGSSQLPTIPATEPAKSAVALPHRPPGRSSSRAPASTSCSRN